MRVTVLSLGLCFGMGMVCAGSPGTAEAAAISTLYGTGVDNSGKLLADGAAEPHYSLIQQPGTSYGVKVTQSAYGNMSGLDAGKSQFVGPNTDQFSTAAVGTYIYRTTFTLAGLDPATASISGLWAADDYGLEVRLNGVAVSQAALPNYWATASFKILSGFVAGANTLDFVVRNDQGATGLRVQVAGVANAIPEPASLAVLACGLAGLALARGRAGLRRTA